MTVYHHNSLRLIICVKFVNHNSVNAEINVG